MERLKNAIKKHGMLLCIVKAFRKLFFKIYSLFSRLENRISAKRSKQYDELEKIIKDPKYSKIFIFYPYTEWDIPVFQRPQQIALSLTKNKDILYLFGTKNVNNDHIDGLYRQIKDNLYVVTDFDFLFNAKVKNKVIHLYSTDTISKYELVKKSERKGYKVLYEYIDEIHESISGSIPEHFYQKHQSILKNENVYVIGTADKLIKDIEKYRNKNYALSTNGVTLEDFNIKDKKIPEEVKKIKDKYKKVICYYGSLAVWFDYELLKKCAKKYPEYAFVLIGFEYDDSYKKSGVSKYQNIIYLGKIDYKKLINYTSNFDLLTIPFVINEVTESTSPVKLFEYMATKKPILTTAMPECKKYKSVIVGENHEDYMKKIEYALEKGKDKKYQESEYKEAEENTWDSKANTIIDLISK